MYITLDEMKTIAKILDIPVFTSYNKDDKIIGHFLELRTFPKIIETYDLNESDEEWNRG